MAPQIEKFVDGKFKNSASPNDGYAVVDCKDVRARCVLEFLVLLPYLEKPTRIIMTIGNTIWYTIWREGGRLGLSDSGYDEEVVHHIRKVESLVPLPLCVSPLHHP